MMKRLILLAPLAMASPVHAQDAGEDAVMAAYRDKTRVVRPCDRSGDAIVVCGTRAERNARERLPLPRSNDDGGAPLRGEAPRASAAAVRQGSCGVVGGQGTGCTGGLPVFQMIGALARGVQAIVDPDADLSPPPPERIKGAGRD
ncbi:hypothetical protein [Sphingomonas bisphenolicum]